jgi:hypothetical protein
MVSSVSFRRLFTVDEANALLPAVRTLTERIQENIRRLRNQSKAIVRHEHLDPEATDFMDRLQRNSEIAKLVAEVKNCVEQIQSYGCICKGWNRASSIFRACWEQKSSFSAGSWVNRRSAIGTGSKTVLPGAGLCSMSSKQALTKKLLTINRPSIFRSVHPLLLLLPIQSISRPGGL